jgi:acyl-CoA dehydrogenase
VVARLAHQVHGAIGTTREHPLHRLTLRLWSWRDDFGSERHWQQELGRLVLDSDPWEVITQ